MKGLSIPLILLYLNICHFEVQAQSCTSAQLLSLNKFATQSSSVSNYFASFAFDGNYSNFSHTNWVAPQPWLQVDLGSTYQISSIKFLNRVDCCGYRLIGFKIFASEQNDFSNINQPAIHSYNGPALTDGQEYTIPNLNTKARYIRIWATTVVDSILNLAEFEVFGCQILATPAWVTATTNSSSQITLNWPTVANATSYHIDRATNNSFTTDLVQFSALSNSYVSAGLNPGTTYYYRVRAVNSTSISANSSNVNATTWPSSETPNQWFSSAASIYYPNTGSVHIGKSNVSTGLEQGYALFVANGIKTEKLKLEIATAGGWADHVFDKKYQLLPIPKLKSFIDKNKHLPGFPSTNKIIENGGYEMGEMLKKQQEAIENLHLYIIQLENKLTVLEQKLESKKGD